MNQAQETAMALMQSRLSLLERKVDFLLQSLNLKYKQEVPPYLRACADLLRQGRRQEAIDAYCETTGSGLAEATAAISELTLLLRDA